MFFFTYIYIEILPLPPPEYIHKKKTWLYRPNKLSQKIHCVKRSFVVNNVHSKIVVDEEVPTEKGSLVREELCNGSRAWCDKYFFSAKGLFCVGPKKSENCSIIKNKLKTNTQNLANLLIKKKKLKSRCLNKLNASQICIFVMFYGLAKSIFSG